MSEKSIPIYKAIEDGENCDGSKILAGVHSMLGQFENGRKFDGNKFAARV